MKVYLDNNVIIDIEQEKIDINDLSQNLGEEITDIYYSAAHIHELNEITADNKEELKNRLTKRFQTIEEITKNKYLFHKLPSNIVYEQLESPKIVYETINQIPFVRDSMKSMINTISENQKEIFREYIGINLMEINNYQPNDVIQQINKKLDVLQGFSFLEIIEKSVELHPDGKSFGMHNRFGGVFELLDMIGYWKDKFNEKSNYARLWDSNHAYFASFCEAFISNDKRTRNKALVAYSIYNIKTKVFSPFKKY